MSEGDGTVNDIMEFLKARLDEDERAARAVRPLEVIYPMGGQAHPQEFAHARLTCASEDGYPRQLSDSEAEAHFARHDPARVLREVEAKRKIMGHALGFRAVAERMHEEGLLGSIRKDAAEMMAETAEDALRPLAAVYADHPDYRDEWR